MKKILALLVSCTLAVSLAGCGSQRDSGQTAENSGKKVRIMIGYENNPGEPIDLACREWKRLVEERSGGDHESGTVSFQPAGKQGQYH